MGVSTLSIHAAFLDICRQGSETDVGLPAFLGFVGFLSSIPPWSVPMAAVSRPMKELLLLSGFLLSCSCAARTGVPEFGVEGYLHRYDLKPGRFFRFENETTARIGVKDLVTETMGFRIGSTFLFTSEGRAGRGISGVVKIEDVRISGEAAGMLSPADIDPEDLKGDLYEVLLARSGGVIEVKPREGGLDRAGLINLNTTLSGIFIPWPDESIQQGRTWSDTSRSEHEQSGLKMLTTMVADYTYLGLEDAGDSGTGMPHQKVRRISTSTAEGGGEVGGMEMNITTTSRGEAIFYFDSSDGILIQARYTETLTMVTEISGAMGTRIPMDMQLETVTRRIR